MELVPKTLREVEFREKLRGYNQDDVDDFLEQVAVGLEALQDQLRQANERARGEGRGLFADDDDPIRRTLVLAQRTADMAIKEAREQADEIVAAAEARARASVSQADEEAALRRDSAESGLKAEVERLAKARETLIADIAALEEHLEQARSAARSNLGEALHWLEDHVHGAPDRPELQADPDVVAEATAAGPGPSSPSDELAPEPEDELAGDDRAAENGSMRAHGADDDLARGPTSEDEADIRGEPFHAGWPGSTELPDDDPGSDTADEDKTKVIPTIGPGHPHSGLFDAEQLDKS
jgi:cell division initiation protein